MTEEISLEVGESYWIKYVLDWERANARVLNARVQVLGISEFHGITTVTTNRRPWNEGGTGSLDMRQIREAVRIPKVMAR
jgi:hypothetical protein